MRLRHAFLPTIALALLACGEVATPSNDPGTLAVLHGELTQPTAQAPQLSASSEVRVALVWRAGKGGKFSTALDLPVQPVFPSQFRLEIKTPPPPQVLLRGENDFAEPDPGEPPMAGPGPRPDPVPPDAPPPPVVDGGPTPLALHPLGDTPFAVPYALGQVVAYVDENHNGQLDLVDNGDVAYVDRVVGTNDRLLVVYFEGDPSGFSEFADSNGAKPHAGYNLFRMPSFCAVELGGGQNGADGEPRVSTGGSGGDVANGAGPGTDVGGTSGSGGATGSSGAQPKEEVPEDCNSGDSKGAWLDLSTLYALPMSNDPELARLMCKAGDYGEQSSGAGAVVATTTQPAQYPSSSDPALHCWPDGSQYTYWKCTEKSLGLCRGTETQCTGESVKRPDPIPSGWPCASN